MGPKPYWAGTAGGTRALKARGAFAAGSYPAKQNSMAASEIQMAIREMTRYDDEDVCQPIADELLSRFNSGDMYVVDSGGHYWAGIWRGEELGDPPGTVYINVEPGFGNWDPNGMVDRHQLRRTMVEEGIHMWFDTDVSHTWSATPEEKAAMEKMRHACGKYS